MKFESAVSIILKHEGGYVNDSRDPGGETKYGISKRAYPDLDIANLTRGDAAEIYRRDYWEPLKCGRMHSGLDLAVFDCGVNQGVGFAAKAIQRAVGATPDGVIGPLTLAAIRDTDPDRALQFFMARRAMRYAALQRLRVYWKGWYRRMFDVHRYAVLAMEE